jgi:hypothetical protein
MYDSAELPTHAAGNVYLYGAFPTRYEQGKISTDLRQHNCIWVTTALLGKALIPDAAYEGRDGSPLKIDMDYLGKIRRKKDLVPGPFAQVETSEFVLSYSR